MNPINLSRLLALRDDSKAHAETLAEARARFTRLQDRHTNGAAPQAVASFNLFQTPAHVAREMAALLKLPAGCRILEPSAGLGRILDALTALEPSELIAVEQSPDCARVLFEQNRPKLTILQRDFLTVTQDDVGELDAIAMNPPFKMRSDIRHIQHALSLLPKGAPLVGLCMNTPHRFAALRDRADHWRPLPESTFAAEGTRTETVLFRIIK